MVVLLIKKKGLEHSRPQKNPEKYLNRRKTGIEAMQKRRPHFRGICGREGSKIQGFLQMSLWYSLRSKFNKKYYHYSLRTA